MRRRAGRRAAALVAVVAVAAMTPADAAVTGITPSSASVLQGDSTAATVKISRQGVSCLRVDTGDAPGVSASVQQSCSDEEWTTRLSVSTRPDTPPGTYPITVDDGDGSSTFSLRVTSPPPPTPPRTTTTRPPPTTTAKPPPPTTQPPATTTTTEPPPTTTTSTTTPIPTTTTTPPPPNDGFVPVPDLIAQGLPKTGLFLPLSAYAFRTCLPLTEPCTAPDSPLVLLPARAHDIAWTPPADATPATPMRSPSFPPVGQRPERATSSTYRVTVLDLATRRKATVTTVTRALDGRGNLVATDDATTDPLEPTPAPTPTEPDNPPGEATEDFAVFDRPRVIDTTSLTEASPVLVTVGRQVLYAVAADPSWNQQQDVIPLFGDGRVPFLVRAAEGPAGILVAAPPGAEPDPQDAVVIDEPNGSSPVLPVAFLAAIAGLGVWTFRRLRQRGVPRDLAP